MTAFLLAAAPVALVIVGVNLGVWVLYALLAKGSPAEDLLYLGLVLSLFAVAAYIVFSP